MMDRAWRTLAGLSGPANGRHAGELRYCHDWGMWLHWDGAPARGESPPGRIRTELGLSHHDAWAGVEAFLRA